MPMPDWLREREDRWRALLVETGAHELEGDVRAQLLIWRSGVGVNSMVIDTSVHLCSTPSVLQLAIWRLNDRYDQIVSVESARVNIPAPIPPALGRTIPPGVDTAGLFIWDGFVNTKQDTWRGLLWDCVTCVWDRRPPLIGPSAELWEAIREEEHSVSQGRA